MTMKKRRTLPNTIKLTKVRAGEPRTYNDERVKEIASHLGPLPVGKILYPGCFASFHILGEDYPEMTGMFQAYLRGDGQIKMSRELAFLSCLETAAWQYKQNKRERRKKGETPSQKLKDLARLKSACDVLADSVGLLDTLGLRWRRPSLEGDLQKALVPLREEIQYQRGHFSRQKASSRQRHQRDAALHDFVAEMCVIWTQVAGRKLSTGSVSSDGKKIGGPLIRFIQAALQPVGVEKSPNAIRELLRDVRSNQSYKNMI